MGLTKVINACISKPDSRDSQCTINFDLREALATCNKRQYFFLLFLIGQVGNVITNRNASRHEFERHLVSLNDKRKQVMKICFTSYC